MQATILCTPERSRYAVATFSIHTIFTTSSKCMGQDVSGRQELHGSVRFWLYIIGMLYNGTNKSTVGTAHLMTSISSTRDGILISCSELRASVAADRMS